MGVLCYDFFKEVLKTRFLPFGRKDVILIIVIISNMDKIQKKIRRKKI